MSPHRMTSRKNHCLSSFVARKLNNRASSSSQDHPRGTPPTRKPCLLPADTPMVVHQSPTDLLRRQQYLMGNKVIFVFEQEFNERQVGDSLPTYNHNQKSDYFLTIFNELQHSVFVIQIDVRDLEEAPHPPPTLKPLSRHQTLREGKLL